MNNTTYNFGKMLQFNEIYKVIDVFISREVTCIPQILDKYVSPHYNNALSNGAFWLIILWASFHWTFYYIFNALFKRMKIRAYCRLRLINSLWFAGFYAGCLFYTGASLLKHDIDPFNNFRVYTLLRHVDPVRGHFVVGFMVLATFFAESTIWECWNNGLTVKAVDFMLITSFMISTWFLSSVEFTLAFLLAISICRLTLELSRACSALTKIKTMFYYMAWGQFIIHLLFLFVLYLMIIPQHFVGPAISSFLHNDYSTWVLLMNVALIAWYMLDSFSSPIFRLMKHYMCHVPELETNNCGGALLDCVLFPPRNDLPYIMHKLHTEVHRRETRRLAAVHTQNRQSGVELMQTIKCVMAIKRRLRQQRLRKMQAEKTSLIDNVERTSLIDTEGSDSGENNSM